MSNAAEPELLAGIPLIDGDITIGSVCSGYDGLAEGLRAVIGGRMAWVADVCKVEKNGTVGHHEPHRSPCTILEHHYPGVPNLGDITKIDWATTPRVHVLCGGTPCQDLSHAGRRRGMTEGSRSNLWVAMRDAIDIIRPGLVLWENVGGAFSAPADSDLERDPRLLAQVRRRGDGSPVLRAAGRVGGDLASLGFDSEWVALRASELGLPHGRLRVFLLAWPTNPESDPWWFLDRDDQAAAADTIGLRRVQGRDPAPGEETGGRAPALAGGPGGVGAGALLPTPRVSDKTGIGLHGRGGMDLRTAVSLLPTPTTRDDKGPNQRNDDSCLTGALRKLEHDDTTDRLFPTQAATDGTKAPKKYAGGNPSLPTAAESVRLLPTPSVADERGGRNSTAYRTDGPKTGHIGDTLIDAVWKLTGRTDERLLPTPRVAAGRTGRSAAVRQDSMSAPSLEQALEISRGELPREFTSWEELPPSWQPGVDHLLPTPRATDGTKGGPNQRGSSGDLMLPSAVTSQWGDYAAAVHRWEQLFRDAPTPVLIAPAWEKARARRLEQARTRTHPLPAGRRGSIARFYTPEYRLNPKFSEWLMGLDDGYVTDVPGMTRNAALKALGNGVVPQQASVAVIVMFRRIRAELQAA